MAGLELLEVWQGTNQRGLHEILGFREMASPAWQPAPGPSLEWRNRTLDEQLDGLLVPELEALEKVHGARQITAGRPVFRWLHCAGVGHHIPQPRRRDIRLPWLTLHNGRPC